MSNVHELLDIIYGLKDIHWVWSCPGEVLTYHNRVNQGTDTFPAQPPSHLTQLEYPLPHNIPRLIQIRGITDYLQCYHEGQDE